MNTPRIIASAALAAALLSPSSLLAQHDAGQVFDEAIKKLQKQQENIQKLKEVVHDAVEIGKKEQKRRDFIQRQQKKCSDIQRRGGRVFFNESSGRCERTKYYYPEQHLPHSLTFNLI